MRLLYIQNEVDVALQVYNITFYIDILAYFFRFQCFKAPEMDGFFDQLMTYQILLDLLFENKRYQDLLDVTDIVNSRQIEGQRFPRNVVVLALAACYKMVRIHFYISFENLSFYRP